MGRNCKNHDLKFCCELNILNKFYYISPPHPSKASTHSNKYRELCACPLMYTVWTVDFEMPVCKVYLLFIYVDAANEKEKK
jgi:hypothetical protein